MQLRASKGRRNWTYQVISEKLHDEGGVLVALLAQGVKLCMMVSAEVSVRSKTTLRTSNGVIESKLGQVASLVGRVEDLVVEDGEVQGQTQTDGVGRSQVGLSDLGGGLVGLEGGIGGSLAALTNGELSEVTVVVTLPVYAVRSRRFRSRWGLERKRTSCGRRPWTRQSGQRG